MESEGITVGNSGTRHRNLFPAIACTAVILALSLWPKPPEPPSMFMFPHIDKVVHFLMYACYAAILAWTFRAETRSWRFGLLLIAYCAAMGAGMEFLQGAFPVLGRTFSVADMLANAIGGTAGVAFYGLVHRCHNVHGTTEDTV